MAIREEIVASAAQFLQDPSVSASSIDSKVAFLQAKNLTPEEVDAALARSGAHSAPIAAAPPAAYSAPPAQPQAGMVPAPGYYQPQYPPYGWQRPPPEVPKRDWRDWFIMATVVGGVGYGVLELTKRYIYPLVAPPTPERLETDKQLIEEQFDRQFALVEQLAKDTEALKAAEQQRTERLDTAILELENTMAELKSANRRREDDAQRLRDDVQNFKDALPKALEAQKDVASERLREVITELNSLKTLIGQRMTGPATPSPAPSNYLRPSVSPTPTSPAATENAATPSTGANGTSAAEAPKPQTPATSSGRPSFGIGGAGSSGMSASIPSWQLAMSAKSTPAASGTNGATSGQASAATPPASS
ncbi:hypothetical protein MCOR27_004131 [Pyricularia oryzae]|uniref:Peroxisomal membrane protein PEX14 n=2 Tax=Pyricularia TaxID=48558 RepID=A0ABQ8NT09_PYRGI|nr:hypothetical protein MCOR01_007023 [Pyricularia oryzae]KAI6301713.1 hypothetical protein MCOR33_002848 [Pyricularia grisea]KAH9434404.1 hypothetical protein MCOR02_006412 [Pyricularia oryzae]KAI6254144.1 hypothetical protein MCOR19_009348 [Pyricularia oryzae]KAI6279958.1 hypothetical protein MCOR26_003927 [Pyricularia oryzae]